MKNVLEILSYIVSKTLGLNRFHILDEPMKINYAAIFCQSNEEYGELNAEASRMGNVVEDTPTGPLYKLAKPFQTPAGLLWLLKIRKPYATHPQRGDADFTLNDYAAFKEKYVKDHDHFRVMVRKNFEMIELRDDRFDVLSYFSSIPLTRQFGIE